MSANKVLKIRRADPADPGCRALIEELDQMQESLYPPESNYLDSIKQLQHPNYHFLGAYLDRKIVGCGALKIVEGMYGEIKRMYVKTGHRQLGIGQRLLEELEVHSAASGEMLVRLETGTKQPDALALYRRNGYKEASAFGDYREGPQNVFMEKQLDR
jgi:putative acetyltransferase